MLTIAAFSPALVVQAIAQVSRSYITAIVLGVIAVAAALGGLMVLKQAKQMQEETLDAEQIKVNGAEGFGVFLTYTLPAIVPIRIDDIAVVGVFATFAVLMAVRSRMIAGNPFLLLLGYKAHDIEASSGVTYILLRKRIRGNDGKKYTARRISDMCYLES